jgi:quinol monooxygenase YgiN
MVHTSIRMVISSNKRLEAQRILISVAERTRIEPGCLSCRIYQGVEDKNVIMMDELWRNNEDLECRLRSEDYLKVLLVVEMALEKPEIRFDTITCSTGVDMIIKARKSPVIPGNTGQ